MNSSKIYRGPLVRFFLTPLIFTMDSAYKGVVVGIGVLILYPFISILVEGLKKRLHSTDAFYITSFTGVLGGTFYILSIGIIDWGLYEELALIFPASMAASSMIIGWLDDHEETSPFIEALISAVLIVIFSCFRDYMLHGVLDFRFGAVGTIYDFGKTNTKLLIDSQKYSWLSTIKLRGITFFIIAFFIAMMGTDKGEQK